MKTRRHLLMGAMLLAPLWMSAQNESEPNDNFGQANALTLGVAVNGDIGGAPCATGTSADFFAVNLVNDGSITITTAVSATASGTLRVYGYNSGGGLIFNDDFVTGPGGTLNSASITRTCLGKGLYYFSVAGLSGDCYTYALTVAYTAPPYADDQEPNNTFLDANANPVLPPGTITSGHVNFAYQGSDNDDRYRLQPANDGTLNVNVSAALADAPGTLRVYVFNSGGGQIATFDAPAGGGGVPVASNTSFTCYGQDTYYLTVSSITGCGISYQLSYTLTAPFYANDTEPNNTLPGSIPLPHDTFTEGHLNFANAGDNDDRYAITTPAEGTLAVTILAENQAGGTVRVYLFNDGGGQINSFDATIGANGVPTTTTASFDCYGQGQYYLQVSSIAGCGASYRLKYQTTGAVYANDVEPNNDFTQALANGVLPPDTYTQGHINFNHYGDNDDRYAVQTAADGTMRLTLIAERVPTTDGTVRVFIFNNGGGQIDNFDAIAGGGNDDDTTVVDFPCFAQGTYYILVSSIAGCGISYKLKYQTLGQVYANDVEPNNDFTQALANGALPPNTYTQGHINFTHYGDNDDRYAIQTADDGEVNLTFIGERTSPADGLVRIYIYNSGTGQIDILDGSVGGDNDDDTTSFTFSCYGGSTYYLLVQALSGCGISYKLGYTLTPALYPNDPGVNNTFPTALPLSPDSADASGHLNFNHIGDDNDDRYRVILTNGGNISFNFLAESAAGATVRLYLYNGGGGQLASQDAQAGTGHSAITTPIAFNALPGDTYYILAQCINGCGVSYRFNCNDADGDGTCNYFDLCPSGPEPGTACNDNSACTINDVIQPNCICSGTLQDADGDGICDANDNCPNLAGQIGDACDDGNAGTSNDVITAACVCAGTLNNDCLGVPGGPAQPGTPCDDGSACTINDVYQANCTCAGTFQDSDSDGICDASDNCPNLAGEQGDACDDGNACTTNDVITAACVCAGTFQDTDSDGICDANDNCPNLAGEQGDACDDGNACTTNDVITAACVCAGTFQDTDSDGICDANDNCPNLAGEQGDACDDGNASTSNDVITASCVCAGTQANDCLGVPGGPAQPGTPCDDGSACTINDVYQANCTCAGTFQDSDSDGICDANDNCPNLAGEQGDACDDGNACTTNDVITAACVCAGTFQDADSDGICDANDNCPNLAGEQGDACDDNNAGTINDVITASCVCAGTSTSCTNWTLTITTDGNGNETTWQIVEANSPTIIGSGGPYGNNLTITETVCVPLGGCFNLIVSDAGGNGISGGGYVLRNENGDRVIDNTGNGAGFTSTSQAAQPFCSTTSTDKLLASQCDVETWIAGQWLIASANPAVSAQYGVGDQTDDGYELWFFNPNGGYSRRVFTSHAAPMTGAPAGALAASYLRFSNLLTNPVPANTLLNVRVRTRVNGVVGPFGPACRFKIDPVAAACPTTQLDPTSGPNFSCGATGRVVGASGTTGRIGALPASRIINGSNQLANRYQFELSIPAEGFVRNIQTTGYTLTLSAWSTQPLLCGTFTYNVRVRASFDNGTTWCPWGATCTVGITNNQPAPLCTQPGSNFSAGNDRVYFDGDGAVTAVMNMWPNPNRGEQLFITIDQLNADVTTATVDIFDLVGRKVISRTIPVNGSNLNTSIALDSGSGAGMYLVNVTAGEQTFTQRLVIH